MTLRCLGGGSGFQSCAPERFSYTNIGSGFQKLWRKRPPNEMFFRWPPGRRMRISIWWSERPLCIVQTCYDIEMFGCWQRISEELWPERFPYTNMGSGFQKFPPVNIPMTSDNTQTCFVIEMLGRWLWISEMWPNSFLFTNMGSGFQTSWSEPIHIRYK